MADDGSILNEIDLYGNTTFNRLQLRRLIPAWRSLVTGARDAEEELVLSQVLQLALEAQSDVHQYLKFIGD